MNKIPLTRQKNDTHSKTASGSVGILSNQYAIQIYLLSTYLLTNIINEDITLGLLTVNRLTG